MFTPPRFVVVDDDANHLEAIAATVQSLGSVCARIHYSVEYDVPKELFTAVRAIFIDLQLRDRSAGSDFNLHYSEIQRILDQVIQSDGGPYLLVVWTDRPDRVVGLEEYLTRFFINKPYARPIDIVPLSKSDYIDLGTGQQISENLLVNILAHLSAKPAMNALVQWETEVIGSAARVLADVASLATEFEGDAALQTLLRRLSAEAVGYANVDADPRSSIQAALLPLLQDHVQNSPVRGANWAQAFKGAEKRPPALSRAQVSLLNTKLHVLRKDNHQTISPLAWGAVCEPEKDFNWSEFGLAKVDEFLEIVRNNLRLEKNEWSLYKDKSKVVQIRVGAACDYAQKKTGPIPYVLAALLPEREGVEPHELKGTSTAWVSPQLVLSDGPVQLFVDLRFMRVRGATVASTFTAIGRIKEQLLLALVSAIGHHSTRPGIIRFA